MSCDAGRLVESLCGVMCRDVVGIDMYLSVYLSTRDRGPFPVGGCRKGGLDVLDTLICHHPSIHPSIHSFTCIFTSTTVSATGKSKQVHVYVDALDVVSVCKYISMSVCSLHVCTYTLDETANSFHLPACLGYVCVRAAAGEARCCWY